MRRKVILCVALACSLAGTTALADDPASFTTACSPLLLKGSFGVQCSGKIPVPVGPGTFVLDDVTLAGVVEGDAQGRLWGPSTMSSSMGSLPMYMFGTFTLGQNVPPTLPPPPDGFPPDLGPPRANRCFGRVTYQAWTFVGTEWQPGILIADFAIVENGEQILGVGVLPPEIVAQGVPVPRITCRLVRTHRRVRY